MKTLAKIHIEVSKRENAGKEDNDLCNVAIEGQGIEIIKALVLAMSQREYIATIFIKAVKAYIEAKEDGVNLFDHRETISEEEVITSPEDIVNEKQ